MVGWWGVMSRCCSRLVLTALWARQVLGYCKLDSPSQGLKVRPPPTHPRPHLPILQGLP